jgi:hypothetical protein
VTEYEIVYVVLNDYVFEKYFHYGDSPEYSFADVEFKQIAHSFIPECGQILCQYPIDTYEFATSCEWDVMIRELEEILIPQLQVIRNEKQQSYLLPSGKRRVAVLICAYFDILKENPIRLSFLFCGMRLQVVCTTVCT